MSTQDSSPSFGISAYLTWLHSNAPSEPVRTEVAKVLVVLDENNPALIDELTRDPVTQDVLATLKSGANWLAPNPRRDRIGSAAARYWAVQLLANTVMRSSVLDLSATHSAGVEHLMRRGAEGLFEFGQSQFEELGAFALDIADWVVERKPGSITLVESPIGNTLPVQVIQDAVHERGVECSITQWNSPRNVRAAAGRTVKDAARAWAAALQSFDLVIFVDEIVSAGRYRHLLGALRLTLPQDKLLPLGMLFYDSYRKDLMATPLRASTIADVQTLGRNLGCAEPVRAFPPLRLFKFNHVNTNAWGGPVAWGDSEIAAGKRKLNLVFTLLNHSLDILDDLGKWESKFARYLVRAWSLNTKVEGFVFDGSAAHRTFADIVIDLNLRSFRQQLWDKAKQRFPDDYTGAVKKFSIRDASARWQWLQETFLSEASKSIGDRAGLAWNAIDAAFPASFADIKPEVPRDLDATPFTLPFNSTICAFNARLRELIAQAGVRRRALAGTARPG
jgi:hypothetical protein